MMSFILVFLVTGGAVQAEDLNTVVLDKAVFQQAFEKIIRESLPWPKEDMQFADFSAKPEKLEVAAGAIEFRLTGNAAEFRLGRNQANFAILSDGREYGTVMMVCELRLIGEVVFTTRSLRKDSVITAEDMKVVRRDISMLGSELVNNINDAVGKQLNVSLNAGAVLYKYLLTPPVLVERGDLVTILAQSNNLRVTAPGEAREQGAYGDMVRVKNLMSRREVYARVVDPATVEVIF